MPSSGEMKPPSTSSTQLGGRRRRGSRKMRGGNHMNPTPTHQMGGKKVMKMKKSMKKLHSRVKKCLTKTMKCCKDSCAKAMMACKHASAAMKCM
jgi:hypothetical protein